VDLLGIVASELLMSLLVARRHRPIGSDQGELVPAE
jgi:hypothetical protein